MASSEFSSEFRAYKSGHGAGVRSKQYIGDTEYRVLTYLVENRVARFKPSHLKVLGISTRYANVLVHRLVKKGLLLYQDGWYIPVLDKILSMLTLPIRKISEGLKRRRASSGVRDSRVSTSSFVGGRGVRGDVSGGGLGLGLGSSSGVVRYTVCSTGVCFDNVRGYTWGGVYVHGDRGRVLSWFELSSFVSVSYAEVVVPLSRWVSGWFVIYRDRIEWRPPSGFVKENGVSGTVRQAFIELIELPMLIIDALARISRGLAEKALEKVLWIANKLEILDPSKCLELAR